ncbi:Zinc finger protein 37 [Aphelenchoides avenae]|nr:Zinc finger protein 37 [Aphelenchus avenae]
MNKSFKCEECPRHFNRQDDLQRHVKNVHDDRKSVHRARSLPFHLERSDDVTKSFKCPTCPQRFSSSTALRGHTILHKRAKGFVCTVCHVKCTTEVGLSTHMRHRHADRPKTTEKSKPSANTSTAGQTPAERVKNEPTCADDLNDEDVDQFLGIIEGMEGNKGVPQQEPEHAEDNEEPQEPTLEQAVNAEPPDVEDEPANTSSTAVQTPAIRVKVEPTCADDLNEEDVNELLGIIEGTEGSKEVLQHKPDHAEDNEEPQFPTDQTAVKAEVPDVEDTPATFPRPGVSVQFKTNSGRVVTAENEPTSMTYGDFRKLFGIPAEGSKRIIFKKAAVNVNGSDQWVVAVDDEVNLPLVNGCVMAETCSDF